LANELSFSFQSQRRIDRIVVFWAKIASQSDLGTLTL
jgi:hypothetical protein